MNMTKALWDKRHQIGLGRMLGIRPKSSAIPSLTARLRRYISLKNPTPTGYGRDVEFNVPDQKGSLIPAFWQLSEQVGPECVIWRYDSVVFTPRRTEEYHLASTAPHL